MSYFIGIDVSMSDRYVLVWKCDKAGWSDEQLTEELNEINFSRSVREGKFAISSSRLRLSLKRNDTTVAFVECNSEFTEKKKFRQSTFNIIETLWLWLKIC